MSTATLTTRTVIYGAGSAGRAAQALLARDGRRAVVAFADGDTRKVGTRVGPLGIVGPGELTGDWFDEIVVASQAWREISAMLLRQGVARRCISVYEWGADRISPLAEPAGTAPHVLVLTDDCVSPGHGIGAVLLRHLAAYPAGRISHVYLRRKGDPFWPNSHVLAAGGAPGGRTAAEIVAAITAESGAPDLVYANVFGEPGLDAIVSIADACGGSVPIIQHFHDVLPVEPAAFERTLRAVAPRVREFWAITDALGRHIEGIAGRPVETVNTFKCEIAPVWKGAHRDLGADFRVVMLGNSHMPWVLHHVRNVWRRVREEVPGLGPIQWYAYPTSVLYVRDAGVEYGPEIEYYGYLNDRVLHEHLCAADLALVPFNIADEPEYQYAAYSVPSRITEFLNAGLPIFAAAGRGTETRRFLTAHGIGDCATIADEIEFAGTLLALMRDTPRRLALSRQGRAYAEARCDVRMHQARLRSAFLRVSGWRQERHAGGQN